MTTIYYMRNFKIVLCLSLLFLASCSHYRNTVKNILPRQSFVKIQKVIEATMCHPKNKDLCITKKFGATASGAVVGKARDGAYVLTAAHVCIDERAKKFLSKVKHKMFFYAINIDRVYHPVEIIATDERHDLCVLYVKNLQKPSMQIATDKPVPGDRIYNIAAPIGIFDRNMMPIFEGFYDGDSFNRAIYSLPAIGGSSGSPIMNHRGELVGMVSAAFVRFTHIAISPRFEPTISFVKSTMEADRNKRNLNAVANLIGKIFRKNKDP
jgi:S1-C subfamily serine protease